MRWDSFSNLPGIPLRSRGAVSSSQESSGRRRRRPWDRQGAPPAPQQDKGGPDLESGPCVSSNSSRSTGSGNDADDERECTSWKLRRARLLQENAGFIDTHLVERRLWCCGGVSPGWKAGRTDVPLSQAGAAAVAGNGVASSRKSHLAHPLVHRFRDPRVESAFATFQANSQGGTWWALAWTLCLGALSVSSIALVRSFLHVWTTPGAEDGSLQAFDGIVYTFIIVVYLVRSHRLFRIRRALLAGHPPPPPPAFPPRSPLLRAWRAFCAHHYVVLLLVVPVLVERAFHRPMLMALHLAISCVFLLTTAGLLLAHAVAYAVLGCMAYLLHLLLAHLDLDGSPAVWRENGVLAHTCALILGLCLVYFLARSREMILREHFKVQFLGAYLFQRGRLEQALADRLLLATLPMAVAHHALDPRDLPPPSTFPTLAPSLYFSRTSAASYARSSASLARAITPPPSSHHPVPAAPSPGNPPGVGPPAMSASGTAPFALHANTLGRRGSEGMVPSAPPPAVPSTDGNPGAGGVGAGASCAATSTTVAGSERASGGTSTPLPALASCSAPSTSVPVGRTTSAASSLPAPHGEEDRDGRVPEESVWVYPSPRLVRDALARYKGRLPPSVHPFQIPPASRFVQRKFCTVLVAKAVQAGGSHLLVPPLRLSRALSEFDLVVGHHKVTKVCNTGSSYTASCGLFESWGSARRDALAAVAAASDLVAIAEALGLDLCVGVASGSVVGVLDPLSHSFYDLVGDVVSSATLMADLGMSGQVFVGDSTHQLLDHKEWSFRLPRVGTHNVSVRLLNGHEETLKALSNPYATSWWFEHRQQIVLDELAAEDGVRDASAHGPSPEILGLKSSSVTAVSQEAWERGLEEGSLSGRTGGGSPQACKRGREQPDGKNPRPFTIASVYELREELEASGSGERREGKGHQSLSVQPWPVTLETLDRSVSDGTSGRQTRAEVLEEEAEFRAFVLGQRLELEVLLLALCTTTFLWTTNLYSWTLGPFLVLLVVQCALRWQHSDNSRLASLLVGLYGCAVGALLLGMAFVNHDVFALSVLRGVFLLSPIVYIPARKASALAGAIFAFLLLNHIIIWIASSSPRPDELHYVLGRYCWYGALVAVLLTYHRQTEHLGMTLPSQVYPYVQELQAFASVLLARTDAVVAKLVPSNVDVRRLLLHAQQQRLGGHLALRTQAVIVHIDFRALSKLDGLVSPLQLCAFQNRLLGMLDGAVRLFSASHLWHSGHVFVVACGLDPALSQSLPSSAAGSGDRPPASTFDGNGHDPVLQALGLSRFIKIKIHEFNLKNHVSLSVRVGIARGTITLNSASTERFDATGSPILIAKVLALRTLATMVTADIALHVQRHAPPEKLKTITFHPVTEGQIPLLHGNTVEAVEVTLESQLPDHLTVGPRLEDFEILGLLGSGGYGSVHLAREGHSGGLVAMKVMFKRRRGVSDLMRVELNVLAQVQHPHVVQFHYCLQTKSRIILVMEYIRGGTLKALLKEPLSLRPPPRVLRRWAAELVLALGYLHSLHVIHRDIKPDNCMVGEDGHLKLMDFGLAKVLQRGTEATTFGLGADPAGGIKSEGVGGEVAEGMIAGASSGGTSGAASTTGLVAASDSLQQVAAANAAWSDNSGYTDIMPLMQRLMPQRSYQASASFLNAEDASAGSSAAFTQQAPFRVLVVEDEPFTRLITKSLVKSMGFQPLTAAHGKKALEVLRASLRTPQPVDLVLLDLELPVMTGPEVLAEMQADVSLRTVPVVVLSVDDRTADIAACMELGAKDYFIKPIRMDMAPSLLKFARDRRREMACVGAQNRLSEGREGEEEDEEEEEETKGMGEDKKRQIDYLADKKQNARDQASHGSDAEGIESKRSNQSQQKEEDGEDYCHPKTVRSETSFQRPVAAGKKDQREQRPTEQGQAASQQEEISSKESQAGKGRGIRRLRQQPQEDQKGVQPVPDERQCHTSADLMWDGSPPNTATAGAGRVIIEDKLLPGMPTREHFSLVGTPYYMCPEMLDRQRYGPALDYWALGILLFECFAGAPPFTGETPEAVFTAIRARNIPWGKLRKALEGVAEEALGRREDEGRIDVGHLEDLVRRLLEPDQFQRLGAGKCGIEGIKSHPFFAGLDWKTLSTQEVDYRPAPRMYSVMQCQQSLARRERQKDKQQHKGVSREGGQTGRMQVRSSRAPAGIMTRRRLGLSVGMDASVDEAFGEGVGRDEDAQLTMTSDWRALLTTTTASSLSRYEELSEVGEECLKEGEDKWEEGKEEKEKAKEEVKEACSPTSPQKAANMGVEGCGGGATKSSGKGMQHYRRLFSQQTSKLNFKKSKASGLPRAGEPFCTSTGRNTSSGGKERSYISFSSASSSISSFSSSRRHGRRRHDRLKGLGHTPFNRERWVELMGEAGDARRRKKGESLKVTSQKECAGVEDCKGSERIKQRSGPSRSGEGEDKGDSSLRKNNHACRKGVDKEGVLDSSYIWGKIEEEMRR
ncbi:agc (camp- cgmp-dependent and protein kinase c) kinase family protein [Nannochloropsis gaditana]|uniref:non-specific serine/threonine protein kinase n=1 Tax=Nannochloropsis gaditana TaxID=72520 RepID=W7TR22_9STRA|nr:agc (camp- cgmp-dependent and protein kinase c) kinase family protein [Nannochloropsis gaditana]